MERPLCVLVVESADPLRALLVESATARGCRTVAVGSGAEAMEVAGQADVAIVGTGVPDTGRLALVERLRLRNPACRLVVLVEPAAVQEVVQAVRLGAEEVVPSPAADPDALERALERVLGGSHRHQRSTVAALAEEVGLVLGINPTMWRLAQFAHRVAATAANVLIQGETGTGKEVFARFIHRASDRAKQPFIAVNCGALPESLLESELFGHQRGAFTGADTTRRGIFEIADRGTLFLDEIGEASPQVQVKLLRLLETGRFRRVGGEQELRADVRIIAATNVPLEEAVRAGRFRADLFYRLDVISIHLPSLRERPEDIPVLADHFLRRLVGPGRAELSPEALAALCAYHWPGNVRELSNALTRAVTIAGGGVIGPEHLPARIRAPAGTASAGDRPAPADVVSRIARAEELPAPEVLLDAWAQGYLRTVSIQDGLDLKEWMNRWEEALDHVARKLIRRVLDSVGGDREEAARRLGITVRHLRYILNEKRAQAR
ncbi:MAG: sigma-54 dependent transcriptional regulator [Symbiobacterium sp.]|mgnify:CR=1 FL=1|uniref:sigma 54-interacting transcriptional regulator n=1 Tax=Symbiobacterium sp. TaxID=1971213 RepID=UPI003464496D